MKKRHYLSVYSVNTWHLVKVGLEHRKFGSAFGLSSTSELSGLGVLDTVILPPVYYVTHAGDVIDYGMRR
jgi:hypothetical protein